MAPIVSLALQTDRAASEAEALFASVDDVVFVVNSDGRYLKVYFSEPGASGRVPEDLLGKTHHDLMDAETADRLVNFARQALQENRTVRTDYSLELAGREVWFSARITPLDAERVLWSAHEITSRRQRGQELLEASRMFQLVLDALPLRVFWKDTDGVYRGCNRAFAGDSGLPTHEIIGHNDYEMPWAETEADAYRADDQAVMDSGQPREHIIEPQHSADGRTIWLETSKIPLADDDGHSVGMLGMYEDITERRVAELKLRQLSQAVEQSPSVVIITNTQNIVEYVNPRFTALSGYTAEEAIGRKAGFMRHDAAENPEDLWPTLHAGEEWRGEFHNRRKDGEEYWVTASISPIRDSQGEITHFLAVQEDITERRKADEALREQRAFLRQVIDASPSIILVKDWDGHFVLVNQALADMYGTTPEAMLGKSDADFNDNPEQVAAFLADDRAVMAARETKLIPEEQLTNSETGEVHWLQTIKVPLIGPDGTARQVMAVATDITARKRLELEAQQSLARREQQVQLSTDVAQQIASASQLDMLFERVVTLVKERFGYYHTQIFRYDPNSKAMKLERGYGEAGRKMRQIDHNLPLGRGVVGTAAATGQSVLAADTTADPDWVPNPFLPETRGELAVPIKLGKQVLGVLDVQSDEAGRLNAEDQLVMEGLCGQIAIAMDNTRLLDEANTFRQLVQASSQAIGIATLDNKMVYVNPRLQELVKEPDQSSMLIHNQLDYFPVHVHEQIQIDILPVLMEMGEWFGELPVLARDGTIIPALQNMFIIRDEADKPRFMVTLITEISEIKEVEQRLSQERNLLRTLIDNIPDLIFVKDRQSRMIINNVAHYRGVLGVATQEEAVGKTDFDFFPEELAREYYADEQALMDAGEALIEHEHLSQAADGTPRWHLNTKVPLRDTGGNVVGLIGVVRDITERKEIEERTARDRNLLRTLIDNIPDSVFVKDRESRNLLNNVAHYRDVLGAATQEEVVGKSDFDFFSQEMAEGFFQTEQRLMASGESMIDFEHVVETPNGSQIWHLNTKVPLQDGAGNVIGLVGVSRNVTERRQAEAERERLLVAEREQRLLAQTLAEVSLALTAQTSLEGLLDQVLNYTQRLQPNVSTVAVAFLDGHSLRIDRWLDAAGVMGGTPDRQMIPLDKLPGLQRVFDTGKPIVLDDAHAEPDWQMMRGMAWQRAQILLPLTLRGRVLGVLWLSNANPGQFRKSDADRLLPLANAAAIALDNNQLLQQAQQHAEREERLNEIGIQLQEHNEVTDLLSITLQELGQTLGARTGRIRLMAPQEAGPGAATAAAGPPANGSNGHDPAP